MNQPNSEDPLRWPNCFPPNPPTVIFIDDDEGDYTVKPIPPEWMAQALAERERILKWLAEQKEKANGKEADPEKT